MNRRTRAIVGSFLCAPFVGCFLGLVLYWFADGLATAIFAVIVMWHLNKPILGILFLLMAGTTAKTIQWYVDAVKTVQAYIRTLEKENADYREWHADHNRLVRELDVAMSGEAGAAKQASLCDLINLAATYRREHRAMREVLERLGLNVGFIATGIIPKDQWGDELVARIEYARKALYSMSHKPQSQSFISSSKVLSSFGTTAPHSTE